MKHEPELDKTVGYVLRKFPVLSETFILNEILALEARGLPIHIFSLQRPNDPRFHEDLHKLKASISYVPDRSKLTSLWRYRGRVGRRYTKDYSRTFRYALKRASPGLFWRFLQSCYIADQTRRCRIGHFHAYFATRPATVAFLASSITNIPFSFTAHAMDIYKAQISHSALAKKIEKAKFVVTISDYNVAFLEKILNGRPANIVRLYNGIDLSRFCPQDGRRTPPFKLICVARLVAKKGHSVLIEACAQLRDRGLEFECWLVGKGMLRSPIGKLIRQHKLQKHVRLLGPHTQLEVLDRYRSAHLYVLPCVVGPDGNRDGLPVSIVEALACGLPVITTPVTGIVEVVRDAQNGLLVPIGDAKALAEAIESVIRRPELYQRLSANARPSVEENFDLESTAGCLFNLFSGEEHEDLLSLS